MGLAVRASRLPRSWVFTTIVFITGITLSQPSLAVAKANESGTKASKSAGKQKPAAHATRRAEATSAGGSAHKATASRKRGKASSVAAKRTAQTGKCKPPRVTSRAGRRGRVVAGARHRPSILVPHVDDAEILAIASRHLGTPYRFGSSGGGSFDCSGFVRTVYSEVGLDLPRSASAQFTTGESVGADELAPGDLVFFRTYARGPSHVGIYVGDRLFIHAASGGGEVRVDDLDQSYYRSRYLGARRLRRPES